MLANLGTARFRLARVLFSPLRKLASFNESLECEVSRQRALVPRTILKKLNKITEVRQGPVVVLDEAEVDPDSDTAREREIARKNAVLLSVSLDVTDDRLTERQLAREQLVALEPRVLALSSGDRIKDVCETGTLLLSRSHCAFLSKKTVKVVAGALLPLALEG